MTEVQSNTNLFSNKNYLLLFFGGLVSRIGNSIHFIGLTWFILDLTNSGTITGVIMLLSTLPGVLLGPFGGVIADRIHRKFLIVGMDFIRGIVVLWLGWAIYNNMADFIHLGIATVLIAICSAFFNPAVGATIPNIVSDKNLQKANSLEYFSTNFTSIIGAAIGGILIAVFGVATVFILNGLSYIFSALSELFIKIPPIKKDTNNSNTLMEDLKIGLRYLYGQKEIFILFNLSVITNFLFAGTVMVGLPFVFKEVLKVNSNLYGISLAIIPAGSVIGAIILSISSDIKNYYNTLKITTPVIGLAFILIGFVISPTNLVNYSFFKIFLFLLGILLIFGVANSICNIPLSVLLQRLIPDSLRGRVFGLLSSLNRALVPISMALVGIIMDIFPSHIVFISVGVIWTIFILGASRIKILRTIGVSVKEG
ncbi:MAG: MFS transporter [Halanaerobiales bacterium]|nr:MFS transporter [Halanaerobiales bacterium]